MEIQELSGWSNKYHFTQHVSIRDVSIVISEWNETNLLRIWRRNGKLFYFRLCAPNEYVGFISVDCVRTAWQRFIKRRFSLFFCSMIRSKRFPLFLEIALTVALVNLITGGRRWCLKKFETKFVWKYFLANIPLHGKFREKYLNYES